MIAEAISKGAAIRSTCDSLLIRHGSRRRDSECSAMMLGLYLLLNFGVLFLVACASNVRGPRLVMMLFLLGFVVGSANNLIEAVFFGVLSLRDAVAACVPAMIVFGVLAPAAVLLAGRWKNASREVMDSQRLTPWALLGIVAAYEILYWSAGELVYPYVADFYAGHAIPPFYAVAAMQVVRSLIFVGAAYPVLKGGLRGAPLVMAFVYAVIGGLAPLLPDNPYMPADIRFYHAIETTASNALFGLVVGFLFSRRIVPAQA
jgi:hypothetical protein